MGQVIVAALLIPSVRLVLVGGVIHQAFFNDFVLLVVNHDDIVFVVDSLSVRDSVLCHNLDYCFQRKGKDNIWNKQEKSEKSFQANPCFSHEFFYIIQCDQPQHARTQKTDPLEETGTRSST